MVVGWWGGGGGHHQPFFLIYYSPGAGLSSDCCFALIVEGVSFRVAGLARPVIGPRLDALDLPMLN